jgi:hypothetical protein
LMAKGAVSHFRPLRRTFSQRSNQSGIVVSSLTPTWRGAPNLAGMRTKQTERLRMPATELPDRKLPEPYNSLLPPWCHEIARGELFLSPVLTRNGADLLQQAQ